jgi:RNA polymerase primary sigma factor
MDERRALMAALRGLDRRERLVLELRYGLRGGRGHTLEEVGRHLGISRKVVRQAEERALKRLRVRSRRPRRLKVA